MYPRERFTDKMGRYRTESIFLEVAYDEDALYSLKDYDHVYKDKQYLSLKKLYLEMEDPTEYDFANKYLAGWAHWQKMCENNLLRGHIEGWREELELKLRVRSVKQMMELAKGGSYQASKWLSDRGWSSRGAGRPTKGEKEQYAAIDKRVKEDYNTDVVRMFERKAS